MKPITFIPGCNNSPENIRHNLRINVQRDLPWLEIEPLNDRPLCIVGGGPSLKYRWHEIWGKGDVLALNNAYPYLVENGITPDYFMLLDSRDENIDFLRLKQKETKHLIAAQCSPLVFDALKDYDTTLYLTIHPDTDEIVRFINKPKNKIAGTAGTVGVKALCMAYALGRKDIHVFGLDSSYNGHHHAYPQSLNDGQKDYEVFVNGKSFITSAPMANQAIEFVRMASHMVKDGFSIELHCDGLLPEMVAYSNEQGEIPLEVREKNKYQEMWKHSQYRNESPGMNHVETALSLFGLGSIIDFGCGTGRALKRFEQSGFNVLGIDITDNSLEEDVNFIQGCLWDLPELHADYGYCTDVMEHIPVEKVDPVLKNISRCTDKVYFNISTRDDNLGALIGKRLHMTLMDSENWRKVLSKYWRVNKIAETHDDVTFITEKLC